MTNRFSPAARRSTTKTIAERIEKFADFCSSLFGVAHRTQKTNFVQGTPQNKGHQPFRATLMDLRRSTKTRRIGCTIESLELEFAASFKDQQNSQQMNFKNKKEKQRRTERRTLHYAVAPIGGKLF